MIVQVLDVDEQNVNPKDASGDILEEVIAFNHEEWRAQQVHGPGTILMGKSIEVRRKKGAQLKIGAPYLHKVSGISGEKHGFSMHLYWPPLEKLTWYFIEKNGDEVILKKGGIE